MVHSCDKIQKSICTSLELFILKRIKVLNIKKLSSEKHVHLDTFKSILNKELISLMLPFKIISILGNVFVSMKTLGITNTYLPNKSKFSPQD